VTKAYPIAKKKKKETMPTRGKRDESKLKFCRAKREKMWEQKNKDEKEGMKAEP
jgi:hypothetical protein